MYKVFYRDMNGVLHSVIKTFKGVDYRELSHQYTPHEWNKCQPGLPFLIFGTREDAEWFAKDRLFSHAANYEVWYCHAREIKPVDFVITPRADINFPIHVRDLWQRVDRRAERYEFMDLVWASAAPNGTRSCTKVKPVEHVSTVYKGNLTRIEG